MPCGKIKPRRPKNVTSINMLTQMLIKKMCKWRNWLILQWLNLSSGMCRCITGLHNGSIERSIKKYEMVSVPMELTRGGGPPMLEGALCFTDPGPSFMAGTCGEAGEVGDLLSDVLGLDDRFRGWAPSSCKGKTATRLAWRDLFSPRFSSATTVPITMAGKPKQPSAGQRKVSRTRASRSWSDSNAGVLTHTEDFHAFCSNFDTGIVMQEYTCKGACSYIHMHTQWNKSGTTVPP